MKQYYKLEDFWLRLYSLSYFLRVPTSASEWANFMAHRGIDKGQMRWLALVTDSRRMANLDACSCYSSRSWPSAWFGPMFIISSQLAARTMH